MKIQCIECGGVGSRDPLCRGVGKCQKPAKAFRCAHDPCKSCNGRGTMDNDIWFRGE